MCLTNNRVIPEHHHVLRKLSLKRCSIRKRDIISELPGGTVRSQQARCLISNARVSIAALAMKARVKT
jgi:hypothetical protein